MKRESYLIWMPSGDKEYSLVWVHTDEVPNKFWIFSPMGFWYDEEMGTS